jgi:putative NADH-flavin reductase
LKIALFGSTGRIGTRILNEALGRGHKVTAIVRDASQQTVKRPNLEYKTGDVLKPESVAIATKGNDAVISAYGPGAGDANQIITAAQALVEGVGTNQPMRLIVVGGAGSLEVSPGVQLVDTPDFPPAYKKLALAHRDALDIIRRAPFDWTYVCPSAEIDEGTGTRTGKYRTDTNQLLIDPGGQSRISMEDFAVAILDEVEKPKFSRARFTVGY